MFRWKESADRAAQDCELIVSYRQSPGPAALFERLPKLVAFLRCAIDIRNVDVAAASKAGVLVTQASAGFVTSVERAGARLPGRSLARHHAIGDFESPGRAVPGARWGRELKGSTLGVIGYGAIGKEVVRIAQALGMRVLINDPYVKDIEQVPLDELLRESDYVVPLAVATAETENLIGTDAFAKMKEGAISSTCRAATWSTKRRSRRRSIPGASPAAPWTSAARRTRCRRRGSPRART